MDTVLEQKKTEIDKLKPLSIKHEQVLALIISGETATESYRQIYGCDDQTAKTSSTRLVHKEVFAAHLLLRRTQLEASSTLGHQWVLSQLEDIAKATKVKNPSVSVKAIELIGKHFGTFEGDTKGKAPAELWTGIEIDYGDGKLRVVTGTGPIPSSVAQGNTKEAPRKIAGVA